MIAVAVACVVVLVVLRRKKTVVAAPGDELPPISRESLKLLFDHLARPDPAPCTHTFKETIEFLTERRLPIEKTLRWLQRNGAGCDCEVIYNTEAEWGAWCGRAPVDEE